MRKITYKYHDPLELVWVNAAKTIGFTIVRDPEVFAAFDGHETLRIGTGETLDADDSLAQMVLHEMCHALVEGENAIRKPDWGLDFDNPNHRKHEFATLRLQAQFADQVGMRKFFGSTTDFRWYYDQIPPNPMITPIVVSSLLVHSQIETSLLPTFEVDDSQALQMASEAWEQCKQYNRVWFEAISNAVTQTAALAKIVREALPTDSLWATDCV